MRPFPDRTHGRTRLAAGAATIALLVGAPAAALPVPVGGLSPVSAGGAQPVIQSSGNTVRVDLNAPRTIIDWQNFNLGIAERADFLFDQRNWIVLNRVNSGSINIDGRVFAAQAANLNAIVPANASGNVWFYSPQGVAFGATSRVDVGGMVATSAAVNPNAFLDANNLNIPFTGSGSGGPVTVLGGAQLNGVGYLAFVAPRVTTQAGASVVAGDYGTAAYGAADSFEIQFTPAFSDLTFFTFLVPNLAGATPVGNQALNIAGSTTGANIYLVAMSRAAVTSQLINAPGLLTGRSSFVEYGQVTISTGRNVVSGQVNLEAQQVAGVTTGSAQLGEINAAGNVNLYFTGTTGIGDVNANRVRAGQGLFVVANNVTIGAGGLVSGDAGPLLGNTVIDAAGLVDVASMQARTSIQILRGANQTGRTVSQPNLRLGPVSAGQSILISNVGSIDAGVVTAGVDAQLLANLPVRLSSLTTSGNARISSNQSITVGTVRGATPDLRASSAITATTVAGTTSVSVGAGGLARITTITGPSLNLDALAAGLGTVTVSGDVRLRIGSFGLQNSLTASNLTIEATGGNYVLGGNTIGSLSDPEFQRIRLTNSLSIYGGVTAPTVNVPAPVYGDIEVQSLTYDPLKIPKILLYANPDHEVRLVGPVDTVGLGSGLLRIGDPAVGSPWAPKTIKFMDPSDPIDITASLNLPQLQDARVIELFATGDILFGSRRFIDLVSATPTDQVDLVRGLPTGVAPIAGEENVLYVLAGRLTMAAGGRILSQNTSPVGKEVGIVLTGVGVPQGEPILTIGRSQKTDIFVSFASGGALSNGQQLAFSGRIGRLAGDTSTGSILINGCPLGVGCSTTSTATQFRVEAFRPATSQAAVDAPVLSPPPPVDDDEREPETVITGSGNEEIWRDKK